MLQRRHREAPGRQLRADRGVQGPAGARSGLRAALPTLGRSQRPRPRSSPERGLSTPSPAPGSSYRKAPRPWEKMISGYPLLQGLKGPFQLTGTLQEPAGKRKPPGKMGDTGSRVLPPQQDPARLPRHPPPQPPHAQGMGSVQSERVPKGRGSPRDGGDVVPTTPLPTATRSRGAYQRRPRWAKSASPTQYS